MFILVCQSTEPWVCLVSLCVCDTNQSTNKKPHYVRLTTLTSVTFMPYCRKHISRFFYPSGNKVARPDMCRSIISLCKISNVAWLPIQPKKQENRKRSGDGGLKRGVGNTGGLHKIGGGLESAWQLWLLTPFGWTCIGNPNNTTTNWHQN